MKLSVSRLIKLEMILAVCIALFTILDNPKATSTCLYLSFIVLFLAIAFISHRKNQHTKLVVGIILASMVSILVSAIIDSDRVSMNAMIYFIIFVALILYIYLLQMTEATADLCGFIILAGMILSFLFPAAYFLFGRSSGEIYLTLNFSNPNLLGMWVLQAVMFDILGLMYYRYTLIRLLCAVTLAINLYIVDLTSSRNVLIALMLGAAILVLSVRRKRRLSNWVLMLVAVFPLVFLFAYLKTINIWENGKLLTSIFVSGSKTLDTRVAVWESSLYHLGNYWLTGRYFILFGNLHNSHLVLLCSYGVVVLILTMMYLYRVMKSVNQSCSTVFQKVCMIAFCITIFMGNAEGALFSGTVGLYIPACSFLLLAQYEGPSAPVHRMFSKKEHIQDERTCQVW